MIAPVAAAPEAKFALPDPGGSQGSGAFEDLLSGYRAAGGNSDLAHAPVARDPVGTGASPSATGRAKASREAADGEGPALLPFQPMESAGAIDSPVSANAMNEKAPVDSQPPVSARAESPALDGMDSRTPGVADPRLAGAVVALPIETGMGTKTATSGLRSSLHGEARPPLASALSPLNASNAANGVRAARDESGAMPSLPVAPLEAAPELQRAGPFVAAPIVASAAEPDRAPALQDGSPPAPARRAAPQAVPNQATGPLDDELRSAESESRAPSETGVAGSRVAVDAPAARAVASEPVHSVGLRGDLSTYATSAQAGAAQAAEDGGRDDLENRGGRNRAAALEAVREASRGARPPLGDARVDAQPGDDARAVARLRTADAPFGRNFEAFANTAGPTEPIAACESQSLLAIDGGPSGAPAGAASAPPELAAAGQPVSPEAVSARIGWLAEQGGGQARIRLHPAHLGELEVRVAWRGSSVEVVVVASEARGRAALEEQRAAMAEGLGDRAWRVASIDIRGPADDADAGAGFHARDSDLRGDSGRPSDRERSGADGRSAKAVGPAPSPDGPYHTQGAAQAAHRVDLRV